VAQNNIIPELVEGQFKGDKMKQKALVIEDDPTLATVFAKALQEAGYDAEIAADGRQAETRLVHIVPALIVLDLHLPHTSGEGLLQQIKANDRFDKTRIIIASADPALAKHLSDQVDLVLEKPVSFHQLRLLANRFAPSNS
jgi:DNA-binding response OmpR family regulator